MLRKPAIPNVWFALLPVTVCTLAYLSALTAGFVFDDYLFLDLGCWQVEDVSALFDVPFAPGCGYRRVRFVSLAIDHLLWGLDPFGYHLTNLVLHGLCVLCVFLLFNRLVQHRWAAAVGATLWGLHPVHTDVITYVAGRRDLLTTLFFLLAVLVWPTRFTGQPRSRLWLRFVLVMLCFGLAFSAKEMAITLPAVLVLLTAFGSRLHATRRKEELPASSGLGHLSFGAKWAFGGLFLVALAAGVLRLVASAATSPELWGGEIVTHVFTSIAAYAKYLELVLLPLGLYGDYSDYPLATGLLDIRVWMGLLGLALIWGGAWVARNRWPFLALGLAWVGVTLLPVSQIVPHHELLAEHYLYLPLVGLGLAVARGVAVAWHPTNLRISALLLLTAIAALYTWRIDGRNADFASERTFAEAVIREVPEAVRGRVTLAHGLVMEGRSEAASQVLEEVLLQVDHSNRFHRTARRNLISTYMSMDAVQAAAWHVQRMREEYPNDPYPVRILGMLQLQRGEVEEGVRLLRLAVETDPYDVEGHLHLGAALRATGALHEAEAHLRLALEQWPSNAEVHLEWAILFSLLEDDAGAEGAYSRASQLDPGSFDVWLWWGNYAYERGRLELAEVRLLQALEIIPDQPDALLGLMVIARDRHDREAACFFYRRLLPQRPDLQFLESPCPAPE